MRFLPLVALAALAAACAPPITRPAAPFPAASEPIALGEGPDGESAAPPAAPAPVPAPVTRPALATAVVVLSPTMAAAMERLRDRQIVIPVAGVGPSSIEDTFGEPRDGGERVHGAVDILAPRNTPVIAADNGTVLRVSTNLLGGRTIYTSSEDQSFVYYYAHLDHYHSALAAGQVIQKGDTLGYVGTTGNAPKDVPHLHFQIMIWPKQGKWWDGEPINPYPFLRSTAQTPAASHRFD
jgi:murein DD-endopeptidase MepM/ murein hydrolase activator NlpD